MLHTKNQNKSNYFNKIFRAKGIPKTVISFKPFQISARIALTYAVIGCLWILFSDKLMALFAKDVSTYETISLLKGWLYVVGTSLFFYFIIYGTLKRIEKAELKLSISYEELSTVHGNLEMANAELKSYDEKLLRQMDELKAYSDKISYMAYYDQLTDLPNRTLFTDKLNSAIERAKQYNQKLAVIFLDINNFKVINDTYGHNTGDELILVISNKLKTLVDSNITLSRLGGDEFTVFIQNITGLKEIREFVNKLNNIFSTPMQVRGKDLYVSSSFGISLYPENGGNSNDLLRNADAAMFKAKETGKNTYQIFNERIQKEITDKLNIERCLRRAIDDNELYVQYQPQFDTRTGLMRGCEALLRWNSRELGRMSPKEFIPVAEETGLIVTIGEWVLETSCRLNKEWQEKYKCNFIVSVNVSPVQLLSHNFINSVKSIIDKTGIDPKYLELEITENILIESFDKAKDILFDIQNMGIRLALDDFGVGYSSLNYLKNLPFNTLKIDKIFIDGIKDGTKEESITETIISFAHKLGLEVIAEGVETEFQLEFLKQLGCDNLQGYLLSRPVDEDSVISLLIKHGNYY